MPPPVHASDRAEIKKTSRFEAVADAQDEGDNGAGELGYRTFHLILGAIAIAADRGNALIARPSIDDRGSVL